MREILLDGERWTAADDIYSAFLRAVGAPGWHGHNFNALRDSISVGQINEIEVPYVIKIRNFSSIGTDAKSMARDFVELIKQLRESGCSVDVEIED